MKRLDLLLAERGLCESREQAQRLIMAGDVLVNGQKAQKPSQKVEEEDSIEIVKGLPYVSRGGLKLEKALACFDLSVMDKDALDVGASTGGFTDCLLQNGVHKVFAVDVGYGQLHWKLRNDPRVVVLEKTNARFLSPDMLGGLADLAVMDVSFISIRLVLEAVRTCLKDGFDIVTLIKPQFEAQPKQIRKGVVRDTSVHMMVLKEVLAWFGENNFILKDLTYSPITGPKGNIEFLAHLKDCGEPVPVNLEELVRQAHESTSGTARL